MNLMISVCQTKLYSHNVRFWLFTNLIQYVAWLIVHWCIFLRCRIPVTNQFSFMYRMPNTNADMVKCTGAYHLYSHWGRNHAVHYGDVKMSAMVSEIASLMIVYWTVYSSADQRKHQSSALLAFVRGIHRSPENSPHKWPVTRKMFSFDDVIMNIEFVLAKLLYHRAMNDACICVYCFILRRINLLCNISRFE